MRDQKEERWDKWEDWKRAAIEKATILHYGMRAFFFSLSLN
jgi:hypothetical protein